MKYKIFFTFIALISIICCHAQNKLTGHRMDDRTADGIKIYQAKSNKPVFDHYKYWSDGPAFNFKIIDIDTISESVGKDNYKGIWLEIAIDNGGGLSDGTPWTNDGDYISSADFNTYLFVKESDFNTYGFGVFNHFPVNFVLTGLTIPLKYHPPIKGYSSSLFNSNFNVGSIIGVQLQNNAQTFGVTFGGMFGVSDISQTASVNTEISGTSSQSMLAFNYGLAILFKVPSNIQLGLVAGFDDGTGDLSNGYIYQNKIWFAFSLNYTFIDRW